MNAPISLCLRAVGSGDRPVSAQTAGQLKLPEFADTGGQGHRVGGGDVRLEDAGFRQAAFSTTKFPTRPRRKNLSASLTGIYVRNYTFDADYVYPKADIDALRRQLNAPGWTPIVEARSKHEQSDVNVFMFVEGNEARGLAIIASEPREFTIVNIVGNIKLEDLHDLEGHLGVPDLGIETAKESDAAKQESARKAAPKKP